MTIGMGIAIAASLLISAETGSESANAASSAAARADVAAPKAEEKVCRRLVTSGSRMTTKVCLTKLEWKKIDDDN